MVQMKFGEFEKIREQEIILKTFTFTTKNHNCQQQMEINWTNEIELLGVFFLIV